MAGDVLEIIQNPSEIAQALLKQAKRELVGTLKVQLLKHISLNKKNRMILQPTKLTS